MVVGCGRYRRNKGDAMVVLNYRKDTRLAEIVCSCGTSHAVGDARSIFNLGGKISRRLYRRGIVHMNQRIFRGTLC